MFVSALVLLEAAKVEDVAEEEADERGGAEDVDGEDEGGEGRLGGHELGDLVVDGGQVEGADGREEGGGDENLRDLRVVEGERLLQVDRGEGVGQAEEVGVDAREEPARLREAGRIRYIGRLHGEINRD